ncbi:MAG: TRAP transporter small permease subunit [Pseudomonadota bacterium]
MADLIGGLSTLLSAFASMDSFEIAEAMGHPAAYVLGAVVVLGGGLLLMFLLRAVPFLDRNIERYVLVATYLTIAAVIFVEVIRRFVFSVQAPWSTTLPPFLFLIMTWFGCTYNVKLRTHLAFAELRTNLPRFGQFLCLCLDAALWLIFSLIVIVTTVKQTANSASNFQILLGTDDVMQWWFYVGVPIAWLLLCARVMHNFFEDLANYRNGEPLIASNAIKGDA